MSSENLWTFASMYSEMSISYLSPMLWPNEFEAETIPFFLFLKVTLYLQSTFRDVSCPRDVSRMVQTVVEDITRWREDVNFLFEWQEQYLMGEILFLP